tara:strand:+ start:74149 stop:74781 length:633 start_codon:yes stop_codon:yes gene_type:complete
MHIQNTLVTMAIAGLASTAIAGPVAETFSLTMYVRQAPEITDGATMAIIDVIGDSSFGTHLLGGQFGISSNGHSEVSDIRWTPADWSTANGLGTYDGAGELSDVIFGQLVVLTDLFDFLPGENSELGNVIGSFEVDFDSGFTQDIQFDFVPDPERFSLKVIDVDLVNRTTQSLDSNNGDLSLGSLMITAPTPSSLALIGLGGLAATKRRR